MNKKINLKIGFVEMFKAGMKNSTSALIFFDRLETFNINGKNIKVRIKEHDDYLLKGNGMVIAGIFKSNDSLADYNMIFDDSYNSFPGVVQEFCKWHELGHVKGYECGELTPSKKPVSIKRLLGFKKELNEEFYADSYAVEMMDKKRVLASFKYILDNCNMTSSARKEFIKRREYIKENF